MVLALIRKTPEVRTFYCLSTSCETIVVRLCTTWNFHHNDLQGNHWQEGTFKFPRRKAVEYGSRTK